MTFPKPQPTTPRARWQAVLDQHRQDMQDPACRQLLEQWYQRFDHLKEASIAAKAKAVDGTVDQDVHYLKNADQRLYGQKDYWATPAQTLATHYGDCEDFAILKYFTLRNLGVPMERLYIMAVSRKEKSRPTHAVLVVNVHEPVKDIQADWSRAAANDILEHPAADLIILDNDRTVDGKLIIPSQSTHPRNYYAMNEKGVKIYAAPKRLRNHLKRPPKP